MAKTCFVMMPFDPAHDGVWNDVIRPAVEARGDVCVRGDDRTVPGGVVADIGVMIRRADYLVADLTTHNPNVLYELGIAHTLGKLVLLISADDRPPPFDLRAHRVVGYSDSIAGAAALRARLNRFLDQVHHTNGQGAWHGG